MKLESLALSIEAPEVRQAFLSARMPAGVTIYDVLLGRQTIDLYVKVSRSLAMPARIRLELLSHSGCKVRFQMRPLTPITPVSHTIGELLRGIPGAAGSGRDTVEIDLVQLSRGWVRSLEISGISIDPRGVTVAVKNVDLNLDWADLGGEYTITSTK
ncbi:MAG TPA: hypothetical protein GX510_08340 [Firmicutes bacterium]|nr:hypothetical protein [Candidatus Fermentithermobacillaceae bacterium]